MTKRLASNKISPYAMSLIMLAIYISNTIVLSPLIRLIINSPAVSDPHLISILFYLQILIPMTAVFVGYAFIIHSVIKTSVKETLPYMIHYQIITLISLLFSSFWSFIPSGTPVESGELVYLLLSLLLNLILSVFLMYAVVFSANLIKRKANTTSHATPTNVYLICALAASAIECAKQLIIELSYIIPSVIEIGSDISLTEIISMSISVLFCGFAFVIGYLIIHSLISALGKNKKIQ